MFKSFNNLKRFLLARYGQGKKLGIKANEKRKVYTKKLLLFIQKKPFTSFFAVLGVFLVLMIVGNILFSPRPEAGEKITAPKKITVYKIGSAPQVSFQGKVEKSGVIKIVAQAPGIVSAINVWEGQEIAGGTNILFLSSNYSGGNVLSYARQISQAQFSNIKDTFDTQKDVIGKQRESANKNKDNADKLREITSQSASGSQALFDLNRTIVDSLLSNISFLESTNVGGANDAAILQAKQQISQFQSALVQTNSSFQSLQVQTNQAGEDISNLGHEIALKQLDIQEKALNMSLEVARLSYNMALVNEANMYPSTPFAGTVNKIFVHIGDTVNPGTVLANISGVSQHVEIVVSVPENIAKSVSSFESSTLYIGNKNINMMPTFISKDATNGTLYSIIYQLDDSFAKNLTDASFINVKIPIGVADTTNIDPYIPLDSIVQTQEEAFVFVVEQGAAKVKNITLGQIQGRFVQVLSGLPKDSQIIIDRNVIEGDKVEIIK